MEDWDDEGENDGYEYGDDADQLFRDTDPKPWLAQYAWEIVTGTAAVPKAVQAQAVQWWLKQLET